VTTISPSQNNGFPSAKTCVISSVLRRKTNKSAAALFQPFLSIQLQNARGVRRREPQFSFECEAACGIYRTD